MATLQVKRTVRGTRSEERLAQTAVFASYILDKMNGKPRPPTLTPKSRIGKWRVFALRAPSSLIWGGWGFAVPFYFVQDCRGGLIGASRGLGWNNRDLGNGRASPPSHIPVSYTVNTTKIV